MLCQICQKKEATVHLTEIINNKVTKLHICETCAREKGQEMETHFGLSDLLAGLANFDQPTPFEAKSNVKCKSCGFSISDFEKVGRLGCPACYSIFRKQLLPLVKRIHGSDRHIGKVPFKSSKEGLSEHAKELHKCKIDLQEAIALENFERAADLRDRIKELNEMLRQKRDPKKGNKNGNK
ncbi:MAG: UvrB/UvrC motif-containing protein [Candidatus Omnitrophica bacterium]|nr:UvrB/UvrC motif-containing protein [Candidatus Omnitrophota bacterium]